MFEAYPHNQSPPNSSGVLSPRQPMTLSENRANSMPSSTFQSSKPDEEKRNPPDAISPSSKSPKHSGNYSDLSVTPNGRKSPEISPKGSPLHGSPTAAVPSSPTARSPSRSSTPTERSKGVFDSPERHLHNHIKLPPPPAQRSPSTLSPSASPPLTPKSPSKKFFSFLSSHRSKNKLRSPSENSPELSTTTDFGDEGHLTFNASSGTYEKDHKKEQLTISPLNNALRMGDIQTATAGENFEHHIKLLPPPAQRPLSSLSPNTSPPITPKTGKKSPKLIKSPTRWVLEN